jgi:hypothetical protein
MNKKLRYYGGEGFAFSSEIGKYEVRGKETRRFIRLSEAREYYDSLNEEKGLWSVEHSELLECHSYFEPNG